MNKKVKTKISTLFMLVVLLAQTLTPVVTVFAEDTTSTQASSEVQTLNESTSQVQVGQGETTISSTVPVVPDSTPPSTTSSSTVVSSEVSASTEGTSESATSESQEVPGTEETAEEDEEPARESTTEEKENTPTVVKELGNIFKFDYFKKNGVEIVDGGEIEFDIKYQLQYKWDTQNLDVKSGDTASIPLPAVFKQWPANTPAQKIMAGVIEVGTYTISGGQLKFVFNKNIEDESISNGIVGMELVFDKEKFLEDERQEIDFDADGKKDLEVVARPETVETKLTKKGTADKDKDATEITWTIELINGSTEALTNGLLTDTLPEGVGEPRDFVVREIKIDLNGNKTIGNSVPFDQAVITADQFTMKFDNVSGRSGYQVEYKTTITDYKVKEFTNKANFTADKGINLPAEVTVHSGERSNPIEKNGRHFGKDKDGKDVIEWTIDVNKSGMQIDNAIVKDELPTGLDFVAGTIVIKKLVDGNEVEKTSAETFPVTLGKVAANENYTIKFQTTVDWSKVNDGEYQQNNNLFKNEADLFDGEEIINTAIDEVKINRPSIIKKDGKSNVNYEDKTLSWTVDINEARHPLENVVLTDILPKGLDITTEDILIDGKPVDPDNVIITPNVDGTTTVTVNLGEVGTNAVKVVYKTTITDFTINEFKNKASLTGDGIGTGNKPVEKPVTPPRNQFGKSFTEINHDSKTMTWKLSVDPKRESLTELKIVDTFPNKGLIMLPSTLEVKVGDKIVKTGFTIAPNAESDQTGYHKGFILTFDASILPLNAVLDITYDTSYDPQYVDESGNSLEPNPETGESRLYVNHAQFSGKTKNGNSFDIGENAKHILRVDAWNSGKKDGQLVHENEKGEIVNGWISGADRKVAWQLYTNYQKQNLGSPVSVTDTLAYEGTIDEESIKVLVYTVNKEGNTTITKESLVKGTDYDVVVTGEVFTLTFLKEVTERYVITFTTTVPDISQSNYVNNATVNVKGEEYPYQGSVGYDNHDKYLDKVALGQTGKEVFIGEELTWQVTANQNLSVIKNAVITDTISGGLTYINDSLAITAGNGTELVKDTDFKLDSESNADGSTLLTITFLKDVTQSLTLTYKTVVVAKDGQTVNNKASLKGDSFEDKAKETEKLTAKEFSWVGGELNPNRGAIKVQKVDVSGRVITSSTATFELWFELNGSRVQFGGDLTTKNGMLEIGNLPLRTYYLKEVKSPDGYLLSNKEIEIVVDQTSQKNIFEVAFENVAKVEIPVTKTWIDNENKAGKRPEAITVKLLANDKETDETMELTAEGNWKGKFTDLPSVDENKKPITYTVKEVPIAGYESKVTGDAEKGFKITNTRKTYAIGDYTWIDSNKDGIQDTQEEILSGVIVELYDETGKVKLGETTTDENGLYIFDNLEAGDYKVKFTLTEDQAAKYEFTKQDSGENDATDSDAHSITGWTTTIKLNEDNKFLTKEYESQGFEASEGIDPTWDAGVVLRTKIEITGTKVWVGGPEVKPTIELQLYRNNEPLGEPVGLKDGVTTYTWTDLYETDTNKEPYVYTVQEVDTPSEYNKFEEGLIVTNTRKTYAIGDYTWIDTNKDGIQDEDEAVLAGVIVELFDKDGNPILDKDGKPMTTTTDENGRYIFDELEAGDYKVKFTLTPDQEKLYEFTKQDSKQDDQLDSDADELTGWTQEIKINEKNKFLTKDYTDQEFRASEGIDPTWDAGVIVRERIEITGTKVWVGGPKVKPTIELQLFRNGKEFGKPVELKDGTTTYTWKDLYKTDTNKKPYVYTVKEVGTPSEYNKTEDGLKVTNTRKTYAIGDYTWIDADKDGIQDADEEILSGVIVELFDKDGNPILDKDGKPMTTTTDKNGLYIFDELEAGDYKVKFVLTEEQKETYEFTKQDAGKDDKVDSDADELTGWTQEIKINEKNKFLTKDYTDQEFRASEGIDPTWDAGVILREKIEVTGTKVWVGGPKVKPTIELQLFRNGKEFGKPVELKDGTTTYTWKDLYKTDTNKKPYVYTVKEVGTPSEYNKTEDGLEVTNTRKTYAIGDYTWIDADKDGIQDADEEILSGVIVELFDKDGNPILDKDGKPMTTTTDKNGLYIFDELEAGDYKVKFVLTEEQKETYEFTKQDAGKDDKVDSDADELTGWTQEIKINEKNKFLTKDYTDQEFRASEGIDPTWDAGVIVRERIEITGTKVWVGGPKVKPTIELQLFRNDKEFGKPVELKDGTTTYTWKDLYKTDTNKKPYVYTVKEVGTPSEYNKTEDGLEVTNTRKTYAIGDYTWIDADKDGIQDADEEILSGVIVELFDKDGNPILDKDGKPMTTTTDKNGLYIFDELEVGDYKVKFTLTPDQEKIYEFTKQDSKQDDQLDSDADEVTGWTQEIKINEKNKFLTKDYTDQEFRASEGIDPTWDAGVIVRERIEITGTKVWVGGPKVKPTIELQLFRNGKKFGKPVEIKDGTTTYTWKDLYKTDTNKKPYVYTVKEVGTPSEYNKTEDGLVVTNTRKTYAIGDYTWIDTDKDGIQDKNEPVLPGVKVELFDENGKKIAETTTDKNGRYIFDELESGKYKVKFTLTDEQKKRYKFTRRHSGDAAKDSNADDEGWTIDIDLNEKNAALTKDYQDQTFKASEGIDPTWDAGVILLDIPVKPTNPTEPKDPKPTKPDTTKPELPQMGEAGNPFLLTSLGILLIGSVAGVVTTRRRRKG